MSRTLIYTKIAATLMIACFLLSCKKTEKEEQRAIKLEISATFKSLDTAYENLKGDDVEAGVFVAEGDTLKLIEKNVRFIGCVNSFTTSLNSVDKDIILPDNGKNTSIIAYYPFTPELSQTGDGMWIYNVNLSNQEALDPEILLIGKARREYGITGATQLNLKPVYAKIKVRLYIDNQTRSASRTVSVSMNDLSTTGGIDVITSEYASYGPVGTVDMKPDADNANCFEAIVLAQTVPQTSQLSVNIDGEEHENLTKQLNPLIPELEKNKIYDISVEISEDKVEVTLVSVSDFYISDWNEDKDSISGETDNNYLNK